MTVSTKPPSLYRMCLRERITSKSISWKEERVKQLTVNPEMVNRPIRWSLSFILGFLYWSQITKKYSIALCQPRDGCKNLGFVWELTFEEHGDTTVFCKIILFFCQFFELVLTIVEKNCVCVCVFVGRINFAAWLENAWNTIGNLPPAKDSCK